MGVMKRPALLLALLLASLSPFWGCGGDEEAPEIRYVERVKDFTQVSMHELDFGRQESAYIVTLTNDNSENIWWVATADVPWIIIDPSQGQLQPWSEKAIRISVDRSQMQTEKEDGVVTIEIPAYTEKKQIGVNALN